MRLLKWISGLLGLIILVFFAVVMTLTLLVDPNQFKPLIISQFKQITGFEMTIPGNLSWSFYPHLGMQATEVSINDPAMFSAKLNNLVLQAKLAPLLHKQLELSKVRVGTLQVNHLQASEVSAKIRYHGQILELRHLRAHLYQGNLTSEATVSLQSATPHLHLVGKLDQVKVADLLTGLSGQPSKIQFDAQGTLAWDVTTQGKKTDDLLSHLNGTGQIKLDKGSIKGIDLTYFVNTAAALLNKEPLPTQGPSGETEFGQLTGTATIKEGVVTTDNLLLDASLYAAKAQGSIDLVSKTLDYRLDINSKVKEKTNKALAFYGKTVPVRVSGSLSDPSVTLDTLALMKEVGQEQLQRVGEEIQKRLPDKANSFIKSLFH